MGAGLIGSVAGCSSVNQTTPDEASTDTPASTPTEKSTPTLSPNLEWEAIANSKIGNGHHFPAPVVLEDRLIVPSGLNQAGALEGYNLQNGTREWELSLGVSMSSDYPYLPANDSVVVVVTGSTLRAIASDGSTVWQKDVGLAGTALGIDDTILVPDGNMIEAWRFDGTQKWTWDTDSQVFNLGYADGTVYTKSGTSLFAINVEDGETVWESRTTIEPSVPPVASGNLLYIADGEGRVTAIRTADQTTEWQVELERGIVTPITVGDSNVYAGGWSFPLAALDKETGDIRWTFDPDYQIVSPAVERDNTVFIGSDQGVLFALDSNDARTKWQYEGGSTIWAPPAIKGENVYFTMENGAVVCLTIARG